MIRRRKTVLGITALVATVWVHACGDGAVEPQPPPPDPPRPTTVTVTPATASLTALGATVQLAAEVRDQNGQVMAGTAVAWTSSDASVATVVASGLVTAVDNGAATITATAGSASGTAAVTVAQEISAITVSPAVATLVTADTVRLAAEAMDANGNPVAGTEFEWASGDTLVAVVDAEGLVTGISAGEVEITASTADVTGRTLLTVVLPAPTMVAVTPDSVVFSAIGQTSQLTAEVRDQAGRPMEDAKVSWSSGDTLVAMVDSAGLVTAENNGAVTITATAGRASGEAAVTVTQSAGSVVVSPATDTISIGDTLRLVAEAFDENGHAVERTEFDWSSSDVSVALVDASGLVTGTGVGRAELKAVAEAAQGSAEITVEHPDRAPLEALYNATDGPNWINNDNWLTDAPLEEWYGVRTNASGRVHYISLEDNGMVGAIPPELSGLADLFTLRLSNNQLTGGIPPELGSLGNLRSLWLTSNDLSGPIPPELGGLAELRSLSLNSNELSGSLPSELGSLAKLDWLWLQSNRLTGLIPPELGGLSELRILSLDENDLAGPIPEELGNLAGLRSISLSGNALTGVVPKSFLRLELDSFGCRNAAGICLPATDEFREWARQVVARGAVDFAVDIPFCDETDRRALEALFEAANGDAWERSTDWLVNQSLGRWHGVTTDSVGRVSGIDLIANGLSGSVPDALGTLTHMRQLRIGDNELEGRLPLSLLELPLEELDYSGTSLCVPDDARFRGWLDGISDHTGTGVQCPPLADRDILTSLYWNAGGPNWTRSNGWLTDGPLSAWRGVRTDGNGRAVSLSLAYNDLSGSLPEELGQLAELRVLDLRGNELVGAIPPELGEMGRLETLNLAYNQLRGEIPAELGELEELGQLELQGNELSGSIPAELGKLKDLRRLDARGNELSGSIPPQLGVMARLQSLRLENNRLQGQIPRELGKLRELREMDARDNELSGPIPEEIGDLTRLVYLRLSGNRLNGSLPVRLGGLTNLAELDLGGNALSGPLPGEFGQISGLETLDLSSNALSGPVPPEFGSLIQLKSLILVDNPGLVGPLPISMTALQQIELLMAGGTELCRPPDSRFDAWFRAIPARRLAACERGPAVQLTQSVQSWDDPVALLAGKPALLRVFVTAVRESAATMPEVRATFYVDGVERHAVRIPASMQTIPTEVIEGDLALSANAEIPAEAIVPGLEMVIEVDPDNTLDQALGVTKRIPEAGRLPVDVRSLAPFRLTLIPFLTAGDPDSSAVDTVAAMVSDPDRHELLRDVNTILPVGRIVVTSHEPVTTTFRNVFERLSELEAMRLMEGGKGYWMGIYTQPRSNTTFPSVGSLGGPVSMVDASAGARVLAHELGHNLGLLHAPCGVNVRLVDPWFPHRGGRIGAWAYDSERRTLVDPDAYDIMSYCWGQYWISDYFYNKALEHRLNEEVAESARRADPVRSLLVWGGRDEDGVPYIDPAFVVDAVPSVPRTGGEYSIVGIGTNGQRLFSYDFEMPEFHEAEGEESTFVFTLPVQSDWAGNLARITLSGPDDSVTLDESTDRPMAILRDPVTGKVRGFLRDVPTAVAGAADAAELVAGTGPVEMLISRGIPDDAAWRR